MNYWKELKTAETVGDTCGILVGALLGWFVAPALLLWSWGIVAPHLNVPLFGYWEMFGIYIGLRVIGKALFKG